MLAVGRRRGFETTIAPSAGVVTIASPTLILIADGEAAGLVDGDSFTITGSGFGTRTQAAPIFFDTIETVYKDGVASSPYAAVANGANVPTSSAYVWASEEGMGIHNDVTYANRTRAYKGLFNGDAEREDSFLDLIQHWPDSDTSGITQYYGTWKFRSNFNVPVGSHKVHRVWDSDDGSSRDGAFEISWTTTLLGSNSVIDDSNNSIPANTWHRYEILVRSDVVTLKGWRNGTLISNVTNPAWIQGEPGGIVPRLLGLDMQDDAYFPGGVWNNHHIWLSDIYMDRSARRVELCTSSTYSAANAEPQLPSAWSNTSITIDPINQGALPSGVDIYGFIMDEANAVSVSLGVVGQF